MDPTIPDGLTAYGPWGLLGFAVLAVLTGRLIPRSVAQDKDTELAYTRARMRELEEQRDLARAQAAQLGIALAQALPVHQQPSPLPEPAP